jgi:hypothetical protein
MGIALNRAERMIVDPAVIFGFVHRAAFRSTFGEARVRASSGSPSLEIGARQVESIFVILAHGARATLPSIRQETNQ